MTLNYILAFLSIGTLIGFRLSSKENSKTIWQTFFVINILILAFINFRNISNAAKVESLQIADTEKTNEISILQSEIQNLQSGVESIKSFSKYASLNYKGLDMTSKDGTIKIRNSISDLVDNIILEEENGFTVITSVEAEINADKLIDNFPNFPFGYYYKAIIQRNNGYSEWKDSRDKAIEIFDKTTSIEGCNSFHQKALNKLKELN